MKKLQSTIIAAVCSLVMCATVNAQKPTLESLLPANVLSTKKQMAGNHTALMTKLMATHPNLKQNAATTSVYNSSFVNLKKLVGSSGTSAIEEQSFNNLTAMLAQQADAKSSMQTILNSFKTGIANAKNWDDIFSSMTSILQSSEFGKLSASDKSMLHYGFLFIKVGYEYAVTNNLKASNNQPLVLAVIGGNVDGKSVASLNAAPFGFFCNLACFVTPGISAEHAWKICEGGGSVPGLVR